MNRIHPTAVLEDGVELGNGNVIGPYAVLSGPLLLGDDNWVGPHAVLGTPAQFRGGTHRPVDQSASVVPGPAAAWNGTAAGAGVRIGNGNVLRETATVQQGRVAATVIGDGAYVMAGAHVNHDACVGDDVVLSNNVVLAGHVWVGRGANLGMAAVVHQHGVVGTGAMVGMHAAVRAGVPPYTVAVGVPAKVRRANVRALESRGLGGLADALMEHLAGRGACPAELAQDLAAYTARL